VRILPAHTDQDLSTELQRTDQLSPIASRLLLLAHHPFSS